MELRTAIFHKQNKKSRLDYEYNLVLSSLSKNLRYIHHLKKMKEEINSYFTSFKYNDFCRKKARLKNTIILFVCPSKILHKRFYLLQGLSMVPRENKSNTYAKF